MLYDNIYEIKENKKDNLKTQNLITSSQGRVPYNTKIHQLKNENKMREREREREKNNLLYVKKL